MMKARSRKPAAQKKRAVRRELRAVDLCAGAGGWACAARGLPIRVVAAVDSWDVCCRTYQLNHPDTHILEGDLRDAKVRGELVAAHAGRTDIVLGAVPCEWLSVRRYLGVHCRITEAELESERQTLRAVLELVKKLAPRYSCLEDVKGLAKELPSGARWIEIDSCHYSAQRRKRIYVGDFPAPFMRACACGDVLADKLRAGPYRIGRRAADRQLVTSNAFSPDRVYAATPKRKSPTVCSWSSRRDAELVVVDPDIAGQRRQMEWQEAASLQGFPSDYVFYGSPGDVWKMLAQAIQIDTGRAILQEIVIDAGGAKRRKATSAGGAKR